MIWGCYWVSLGYDLLRDYEMDGKGEKWESEEVVVSKVGGE